MKQADRRRRKNAGAGETPISPCLFLSQFVPFSKKKNENKKNKNKKNKKENNNWQKKKNTKKKRNSQSALIGETQRGDSNIFEKGKNKTQRHR